MRDRTAVLLRAYRYRLYPTAKQSFAIYEQLAFACQLYNAGLEQRRDAWRRRNRPITLFEQFRDLTDVRAALLGPPNMACEAMRDPLRRLNWAFGGFFRRVKAGQKPGYPRFRSRRRYSSLTRAKAWTIVGRRVALPGIGHVKVRWHRPRPADAELRTVTVRRHARNWYFSFAVEVPKPTGLAPAGESVGLDLGILAFATLSTGERILGPRSFRAARHCLRLAQRRVARRARGSRRRRKAGQLVARLNERVRNVRRDWAFKLAKDLVRRFDVIYVESLNLKGLAQSRLARDVQDQAWGAFLAILTDKAAEAGRSVVPIDARNTSQVCSACGATVPKPLRERWHRCTCGYEADRDVNAARNLYRLGESRQARTWPMGACVA